MLLGQQQPGDLKQQEFVLWSFWRTGSEVETWQERAFGEGSRLGLFCLKTTSDDQRPQVILSCSHFTAVPTPMAIWPPPCIHNHVADTTEHPLLDFHLTLIHQDLS